MIVDADPQATLRAWESCGNGFGIDVLSADKRQTLLTVQRIAANQSIDCLFIDTPGNLKTLTADIISISDFIVVPLQPSFCDAWATIDTLSLVRAGMRANPKLQTLIVFNAVDTKSIIQNTIRDLIVEHAPDFNLSKNIIPERVAFARCAENGLTIFDSKDRKAIEQIEAVSKEIFNSLNGEIFKNENE